MIGWISVDHALPEDRLRVLFWCPEFEEVCKGHYSEEVDGWMDENTSQFLYDTTYWMHLPGSPK